MGLGVVPGRAHHALDMTLRGPSPLGLSFLGGFTMAERGRSGHSLSLCVALPSAILLSPMGCSVVCGRVRGGD